MIKILSCKMNAVGEFYSVIDDNGVIKKVKREKNKFIDNNGESVSCDQLDDYYNLYMRISGRGIKNVA